MSGRSAALILLYAISGACRPIEVTLPHYPLALHLLSRGATTFYIQFLPYMTCISIAQYKRVITNFFLPGFGAQLN